VRLVHDPDKSERPDEIELFLDRKGPAYPHVKCDLLYARKDRACIVGEVEERGHCLLPDDGLMPDKYHHKRGHYPTQIEGREDSECSTAIEVAQGDGAGSANLLQKQGCDEKPAQYEVDHHA